VAQAQAQVQVQGAKSAGNEERVPQTHAGDVESPLKPGEARLANATGKRCDEVLVLVDV
jgi:hypothetical protein